MDINVGVAGAGGGRVAGISIRVGIDARGVNVGGIGVSVAKTSTEKLQASRDNALNRKRMTGRYHFCCLIAFSLSALNDRIRD